MSTTFEYNIEKKSIRASIAPWWEATRPRMFSVWLASGIIPGTVARLNGVFEPATFLLELLLCFLLLTLSCWADEYGDLKKGVDGANRLGPIRPLQRGEILPATMLRACIVLAVICGVVGVLLVVRSFLLHPTNPWGIVAFLLAGAVCIAAAFGYTMGKRPYGYRGLGDLVSFFFFGPVAGVGGFWLYAHTIDWLVLLPASAAGFLLVQTINLQNLRDFDNDRFHGKNTTAIILGRNRVIVYHYLLSLAALLCYALFPIASGLLSIQNFLFILAFIPLINHCIRFRKLIHSGECPSKLDTLMWPLSRAMGACAALFCLSILSS